VPDIFLRSVPSDANRADVRLYDPTTADIGGALTANLAVTEADDLLASTSMLALSAALAVTEADDALTAAAALLLIATLAATEADDALAAAAVLVLSAALSATEADDALSADATLVSSTVTADLAVTEADDALAASGGAVINAGSGYWGPESGSDRKRRAGKWLEENIRAELGAAYDAQAGNPLDHPKPASAPVEIVKLAAKRSPALAVAHDDEDDEETLMLLDWAA